jgi:hypothetical protein
MMRISLAFFILALCLSLSFAKGQQVSAPEPQSGRIIGTVTDVDGDTVPGASVVLDGGASGDHRTVTANENGFFTFEGVRPAGSLRISVNAKGFSLWTSPELVLKAGQALDLTDIKLTISVVETTVTAVTQEQLATEEVKAEEKQRVFGVFPNFYVAYNQNPAPLTTKLKFKLALKASIDPVNIAGTAVLAGFDQAGDTPDYQQGLKGYGQRFGAGYADGTSDILIGGAILPSLLHQDPRYFYQGTGTNKSRALHALASPFWCRGDDGHWEFNYSSVGGDLASGALSNLYYPPSNRGPGLVFGNAAITTAGRMANALAQEFLFRRFTSNAKKN